MKQILIPCMLACCLASCSNLQTNKSTLKLTGDIRKDVQDLAPNGNHIVDIMDGVKQNPRQAALTKKFEEGVKNNYDWFVDYLKTVPDGEPMPYHAKLGLTETEYEELMGYLNNIELISSGKENIIIEIKNDTIHFRSEGKLRDYNSLKIDLKNNTILFGAYKMIFADTNNITNDQNGFKSKWKGYTWRFEDPKDLESIDLKDLGSLKMKQYKFTIGKLEKNGKTYMSLKGREVEDGAKTVDFELPVVF